MSDHVKKLAMVICWAKGDQDLCGCEGSCQARKMADSDWRMRLAREAFEFMKGHMSDTDHEAYGAMVHRAKVEEQTRGRDYHNELAAELAAEKSAHADCVDRFLAVSAAERDARARYSVLRIDLHKAKTELAACQKERDRLREGLEMAKLWMPVSGFPPTHGKSDPLSEAHAAIAAALAETGGENV